LKEYLINYIKFDTDMDEQMYHTLFACDTFCIINLLLIKFI